MKFYHAISLICLLSLAACSSKKKLQKSPKLSETQIQTLLTENFHNSDWFEASGKVKIRSTEGGVNASIQIRAKKDSILWVMGKKLSIEGGRFLLKKDSIYMLNRLENYVEIRPLSYLEKTYGTTFSRENIIQIAMIKHPVPKFDSIPQVNQDKEHYIIECQFEENDIIYYVDKQIQKLVKVDIINDRGYRAVISYNDFKAIDNTTTLPHLGFVSIYDDNELKTEIEINLNKIRIDREVSFPFKIPSRYQIFKF